MGFKVFFLSLNSLVPDGGLSPSPPQFGYNSERRSILSSSTSNTKVAPPAGEKWDQNENQGHREMEWVQEMGGRKVYYLESLGELPALRTLQRCTKKVSRGQAVRCSADYQAETKPLPIPAQSQKWRRCNGFGRGLLKVL